MKDIVPGLHYMVNRPLSTFISNQRQIASKSVRIARTLRRRRGTANSPSARKTSSQLFSTYQSSLLLSESVYDQVITVNDPLRQLKDCIDWKALSDELVTMDRGKKQCGRPSYPSVMMLRILFLCSLWDLSDRQMVYVLNDSIKAKYFVGLALDKAVPNHSTISLFRRRLAVKQTSRAVFEELVLRIIQKAWEDQRKPNKQGNIFN